MLYRNSRKNKTEIWADKHERHSTIIDNLLNTLILISHVYLNLSENRNAHIIYGRPSEIFTWINYFVQGRKYTVMEGRNEAGDEKKSGENISITVRRGDSNIYEK